MDKQIAENLIRELSGHPGIISPDKNLFLGMLVQAEVPESPNFYETLQDKQQLVEEGERYHYLSLQRILRNENARDHYLPKWKKAYESIASILGVYSSDGLTRDLRANKTLIEMIAECEKPFSLLGKFQTYDHDNLDRTLFVITRPVLVIPGAKDTNPIYNWEHANTVYQEEVGLIFRHLKRIKAQEYFSH